MARPTGAGLAYIGRTCAWPFLTPAFVSGAPDEVRAHSCRGRRRVDGGPRIVATSCGSPTPSMMGMKGLTTMKRHRHTPEQIVRKLREGDRLLNEGKDITEVVRHLEIAESTWNRWRSQYGGMKADEAKRLRQLETENARLKKLLAEAELDNAMLKELAEGNF
jgi:putative transposase